MNEEQMKEKLNDLHDGTYCSHCHHRGNVKIPNGERVIEEAYKMGYYFGIPLKEGKVRSEPTTGAGLVKEADDCIKLAHPETEELWVCESRVCQYYDCQHCLPHLYISDRPMNCGHKVCIPYVPDNVTAKFTDIGMKVSADNMRIITKGLRLE